MELSKEDLDNIALIFRKVKYGKITFDLNPEMNYLQFKVEEMQRVPLEKYKNKKGSKEWEN